MMKLFATGKNRLSALLNLIGYIGYEIIRPEESFFCQPYNTLLGLCISRYKAKFIVQN